MTQEKVGAPLPAPGINRPPMNEERGLGYRILGWILLALGVIILVVAGVILDGSAPVPPGTFVGTATERVVSLHGVHQRELLAMIGGFIALAGILFIGIGSIIGTLAEIAWRAERREPGH